MVVSLTPSSRASWATGGGAVLDVGSRPGGGGGVGVQSQLHDPRRSLTKATPRATPIRSNQSPGTEHLRGDDARRVGSRPGRKAHISRQGCRRAGADRHGARHPLRHPSRHRRCRTASGRRCRMSGMIDLKSSSALTARSVISRAKAPRLKGMRVMEHHLWRVTTFNIRSIVMTITNSRAFIRELRRHPERFYVIHYSCQSLYDDNETLSPRITSIAVTHFSTEQTVSYSTYSIAEELNIPRQNVIERFDEIERDLLEGFYKFARERRDKYWVHWNMRNLTYGFEHLEHRYRKLSRQEAPIIPVERRINLNDMLSRIRFRVRF